MALTPWVYVFCMGFLRVRAASFLHAVACPFHSFVTCSLTSESSQGCRRTAGIPVLLGCYTEKATPARHGPERQHNARSNRRKQRSPNETKPYSNPTPPFY